MICINAHLRRCGHAHLLVLNSDVARNLDKLADLILKTVIALPPVIRPRSPEGNQI